MESPTALSRGFPRSSKKRTFPGGGSSSAPCEEGKKVLEVSPPPMDGASSKPNCSKHIEVPEIIDVDMEEDCDDASLMDSEVDGSAKGKKVLSNSSVGVSGGSADEESGDDIATSNDGDAELEDSNEDDFSSDLYFGEDEWMDTDYDNMIFDDNDHLEAHFDNMELPPGVEAPIPWFGDSPKKNAKVPSTSMHSGASLRTGQKKLERDHEITHKYETFAKFDTVEDFSDHHYANKNCPKVASKNWSKRIQGEWKSLEKNLPAMIYVRAYEARMDLLRAVIIGAEGTPYHDGLFFFDVYFPSNYPQIPPEVHYHSGGHRINPNLYANGKVCLSLLNTWSGKTKEKWIAGESTILQVLVSIQGLILNKDPYFNEPGYEGQMGTEHGEKVSSKYNESTFMYSLKTMIHSIQKPPKHFEEFIIGYFRKHARYILVSCVAYLNGAQVGCLVRGGVRDVDNKDAKRCSDQFRKGLRPFLKRLIDKFMEIDAYGCEDFLAAVKKEGENAKCDL